MKVDGLRAIAVAVTVGPVLCAAFRNREGRWNLLWQALVFPVLLERLVHLAIDAGFSACMYVAGWTCMAAGLVLLLQLIRLRKRYMNSDGFWAVVGFSVFAILFGWFYVMLSKDYDKTMDLVAPWGLRLGLHGISAALFAKLVELLLVAPNGAELAPRRVRRLVQLLVCATWSLCLFIHTDEWYCVRDPDTGLCTDEYRWKIGTRPPCMQETCVPSFMR